MTTLKFKSLVMIADMYNEIRKAAIEEAKKTPKGPERTELLKASIQAELKCKEYIELAKQMNNM